MPDLLPRVCVLLAHASAGVCATSQTTLGFSTQRLWITYNLQVLPLSWSTPGVRTFGSFCLASLKSFPRHLPCFCCDSTASHTAPCQVLGVSITEPGVVSASHWGKLNHLPHLTWVWARLSDMLPKNSTGKWSTSLHSGGSCKSSLSQARQVRAQWKPSNGGSGMWGHARLLLFAQAHKPSLIMKKKKKGQSQWGRHATEPWPVL